MRRRIALALLPALPALAALTALTACHSHVPSATPPEKHLVLIHRPGAAIYIDRVDNRVVMQNSDATGNKFCSFRIGLADSMNTKPSLEKERYFQYTMQGDWKALAGGDTLLAVFFQEKPSLNAMVKEGVMVFETPEGRQPDTLIYRDSYGAWGTQLFVLNSRGK